MRSHCVDAVEDIKPRPVVERVVSQDIGVRYRAAVATRADALGPAGLIDLQRSVGNAAVAEMMKARRSPTSEIVDREFGELRAHNESRFREVARAIPSRTAPIARRPAAVQRCGSGSGCGQSTAEGQRDASDSSLDGVLPVQTVVVQRLAPDHSSAVERAGESAGSGSPGAVAIRRHPVRLAGVDTGTELSGDSATPAQAPVPRTDLDGHLDLLAGAALVGAPVETVARQTGRMATVQRLSLNPLDLAKKVWSGIQSLGSSALDKAKSLGSAALGKAVEFGSGVASKVGSAIKSAVSAIGEAARSGVAKLGGAVTSALQTVGNLARQGASAVAKVAKSALDGALRLGKGAWDKAAAAGRKALDIAKSAGRSVVDAGKSLVSGAWNAVKGKVGGLWDGLKARANGLKNKVLNGAKGLLVKAAALGGKAVDAAKGLADKVGGAICSAIGKATAWVYGKVAPLAKKAWEWAKENPAKTIAMLLIPGGALVGAAIVLQTKMVDLAKKLFAPVVQKIAAKAKAAWNTAKQWGTKAFNTAKQWAGKAVSGATALGKKALNAATTFGKNVLGKAKDIGGKVIGKAKEWGQQVLGKAKDLGGKVWNQAKELGGKLLGIADKLTGGMASKVKGLADKILGKASGVLSWVMSKAKGLADRALSSAKALASKALSKAKDMASKAWDKAKDVGSKLASKAKDFASSALVKGKELLVKAGKAATDFGKKALQGAKDLAGKALAKAKEWGAKAWSTAKEWGGKAWKAAKDLGGKAWDAAKKTAGKAWDLAKGIGAKLAPYAKQIWDGVKKVGKALGIDRVIAVAKSLKDKAFDLAKRGLVLVKDKVLPLVEKIRQARNSALKYTALGAMCKAVGCAYRGFIPKKGGEDLEGGLDLATDVIPVVSTVKDTCSCLVGENFVTNKPMGAVEQGASCAFAALDIAGYLAAPVSGGASAAGAVGLRTVLKGGLKVGGKVIAKEALEAVIKKGGKELVQTLGKEGLEELVEKLGKEGVKELLEKLGKKEAEAFVEAAGKEGVKGLEGVLEKSVKEGAEEAGGKGARRAGDVTSRRSVDGASEVKVKDNGIIEVCPIQRCPSLKDALGEAGVTPEVMKHADAAEALAKEGKAEKAAGESVEALAEAKKSELPLLPEGTRSKVTPGALEPHELAQAKEIVELRGGHFQGPPKRSFPGIDGTLDGVPVSLKQFEGISPAGVLTHASRAERQAKNAGITGVEVYIHAENVPAATLIDFATKGPLVQIPAQGTVRSIHVKTADGWVVIPGSR